MQLAWHMKKYSHISSCKNKNYFKNDDQYYCAKCNKSFNFQTNVIRHIRTGCKMDVTKTLQQCTICSKMFEFKGCVR